MSEHITETVSPVLDNLFRGASGLRAAETPEPNDTEMVAYLCGALSPDEADHVRLGLVRHSGARRRLRHVAEELASLQAAPFDTVTDTESTIARAWRALINSYLANVAGARSFWAAGGWNSVRAQTAAGGETARAAWGAFLDFTEQWQQMRRVPRLAEARGDITQSAAMSLPDGVVLTLEADIAPDGALVARARLQDNTGQPTSVLDSQSARLALANGSDIWPLAETFVRDSHAEWRLPGAGIDLGLQPGPLPAGHFSVLFGSVIEINDTIHTIRAHSSTRAEILVDIQGAPHVEAGQLTLTLALSAPVRTAFSRGGLCVSVRLGAGLSQMLGQWPVSEWDENARLLKMPCPAPDGILDTALLSLDFIDTRE